MILHLRNSRIVKALSLLMVFVFLVTLNPSGSYALTGGPAQPEFNSFTPIGTSDMVDLASGDFSYNIPLMDVGGFPINLAYSSGVTMDQEASWVGLGWDLSIGQINRQMRGLPDDFDGDEVLYENNIKDNVTVGGSFQFSPEALGIKLFSGTDGYEDTSTVKLKIGLSAQYNSYTGVGLSPSAGVTFDLARMGSVSTTMTSTPDGLVLSPSISLNPRIVNGKKRDGNLGASFGTSFNSRQGLTSVNMSTSMSKDFKNEKSRSKFAMNAGSSKSFVPNTYTPTIQANMATLSSTFNAALGFELFGMEGEGEISAFTSAQRLVKKEEYKKSFGYEHTHKAPKEAILDFNREKDGVFTVNSTNLPLTNYTYDLYSVQGQGVGGMFQPYRSQVGYVFDNNTYNASTDISGGFEIGTGNAAHTGGDVETVYSMSQTGIWEDDNDAIENESFDDDLSMEDLDYEEVYFKNVGDLSADQDMGMYSEANLGAYNPIQFSIGGGAYARNLNNNYLLKGGTAPGSTINRNAIKRSQRVRRNQTILKVTAAEADSITSFTTPGIHAKPHHTAGFVITRNDGARYYYGKALYNTQKREATFAVGSGIGGVPVSGLVGDVSTGLVTYLPGQDNSKDNIHGDHYFNRINTPAYGHTFLLTSLVSTDYSDTDGELGPSEGDMGSYTKFQYRDMGLYKWRVPFEKDMANFNEGLKTDPTDDKASYVYGEKETSYIQKIETKTHVALFYISPRKDGYGVNGEDGGLGSASKMYQLDKIVLYSRGEFYADAITTAEGDHGNIIFTSPTVPTPIKTAHFVYENDLCVGVPNNIDNYSGDVLLPEASRTGGKLSLKKVYFTYRNSNMGQYAAYDFTYNDINHDGTVTTEEAVLRNPNYNLKGYDIWGCYKENQESAGSGAVDPLSAPEFNYVEQNTDEDRAQADHNAAAWSITDISLPSGGKIQIDYESDDYQYVQDKKAMRMFKLVGAGDHTDPNSSSFDFNPTPATALGNQTNGEALLYSGGDNALYLYFELDEEDQILDLDPEEFRKKYVNDIYNSQDRLLQFRMLLNMTHKGGKNSGGWEDEPFDYVSGYAELDNIDQCNSYMYGGVRYGSVKIKPVKMEGGFLGESMNTNPISKAGWHFGRKYLSKYIYGGGDVDGDGADVEEILGQIKSRMADMIETFTGPNARLHEEEIARRFVPEKSWIRLCEPTTHKKGGGCRVKQIAMTDEWASMNGLDEPTETEDRLYNQKYGQEYTYTLKDGGSSGVATYEPVGCKENPLVQPVFVNTNRLLAPDEENYMEEPFGESFFPNPQVTYSRVSVKNLERVDDVLSKSVTKHATGHVVTEFYTSKDYPVIADQTILEPKEDSNPLLMSLLQVNIVKHLTVSQGYLIHLNDMNGKMKSQRVYAEGQIEAISGVDYLYDHHTSPNPEDWLAEEENMNLVLDNKGRLKNLVHTIDPNGQVSLKDIGVEYNIVNDFREMRSLSTTSGMDINAAFYTIGPIPIAIPVPIPKFSRHADQLRIATTTKIINSYGILRATVAHDAGAAVSTRNLAWDSETGEVLVTETINEYDDKYYSMNYPAHWYYKGMGQAAFNSGLSTPIVPGVGAGNYKTVVAVTPSNYFHVGDEVLINDETGIRLGWIDALTGTEFSLIDVNGEDLVLTGDISMRVIRSGRRNIQSTSMGSIVMMENPVGVILGAGGNITNHIFDTDDWSEFKIVNTGAVEFREDWALQCECGIDNVNDTYNPYRYNTLGIWRAYKSHLYLTGRHQNAIASPRMDGFYNDYTSFYEDSSGWIIAPDAYTNWTFTSEVTQYSPYGFELENADALGRYSAAQYGYNFSFPLAVAANSGYAEMGFDGFEDYNFDGCQENEHFGFRESIPSDPEDGGITNAKSHTGRFSMKVVAGTVLSRTYKVGCNQ